MDKNTILDKLKNLNLNKNDYIIISGASLVLQGIIEKTSDIDLATDYHTYKNINWPTKIGAFKKEIKYFDCFEISDNLFYKDDYVIIDGYKCQNISRILQIKEKLNRQKDKQIIAKLRKFLK